MIKLLRYLRKIDWFLIVCIIGFTILQVWCTMSLTDYTKEIIQSINLASINGTNDIWINAFIMIGIAAAYMVIQAVISIAASIVAASIATNIRHAINEKVASFSLAEINKYSTASLITRTTNDIQQYQNAVLMCTRMLFSAPITAIWAICKIQATSGTLTIATACTVLGLIAILTIIVVIVLPKFRVIQKMLDGINRVLREGLTGIRVVHAYNAETYQEEKFNKENNKLINTQIFASRVSALLSPILMVAMSGMSLLIYYLGATLINKGQTDYATITSFMMLSTQIIMSFIMVMILFIILPRSAVAAGRINEVLNTTNSICDPVTELETTEEGTVEFKDVSFAYEKDTDPVISNISFKANKGETVAFIGSTGSGKSTLINLIPRLYDASEGEVLVDGVNVKDLKQTNLHAKIGFVPQKRLLFSGTVRSNIAFGNPSLSNEEIVEAAKIAEADGFINEMEDGYDAHIAQGGSNVSGGQNQRLCIARAMAKKPEILIFDDSFSALDFKTDKQVRENISSHSEATKLIVAQRIGTIMDANQIIVLDQGKMVGKGTHRELLNNCEIYRDIALSQLSKEELGL